MFPLKYDCYDECRILFGGEKSEKPVALNMPLIKIRLKLSKK